MTENQVRLTWPVVNMWWAQTANDSEAIPKKANTRVR